MRIRHLVLIALASTIVAFGLATARPPREGAPCAATSDPAARVGTAATPLPPPSLAPVVSASAASAPVPAASEACPTGMVLVDALHCPYLAHRCADRAADGTCWRFVPEVLCEGDRRRLRFCIDRLEYTNLELVRVATMVSFAEAERACAAEDKRLCRVAEWELACEGAGMWPFPTGVRRDPRACAVDGPGSAAGATRRLSCASPFGAVDLAGGADEWMIDEAGSKVQPPFQWARGGGSWRRGRTCRDHVRNEAPSASDVTGFRCCSDAAPARRDETPAEPPRGAARPGGSAPLGGWRPLAVPPEGNP